MMLEFGCSFDMVLPLVLFVAMDLFLVFILISHLKKVEISVAYLHSKLLYRRGNVINNLVDLFDVKLDAKKVELVLLCGGYKLFLQTKKNFN